VRYGVYDLPWLLHSLRFGPWTDTQAPGLAIDGAKGLSAIESFVLARLFMFQQVYFHKTTRAAEWMMNSILARALSALSDGMRLPDVPAALRAIARGDRPTIPEYLALDDQTLLGATTSWRNARDPVLADLCRRLHGRNLFKTVELWGLAGEGAGRNGALRTARDIASAAGLDPDVYVGLDEAEDVPYADDPSLTVRFAQGEPRHPAEVSFLLDRLKNERLRRVRILFAPELLDAIRQALLP
jgi:HD superfamily phosphohydrolase